MPFNKSYCTYGMTIIEDAIPLLYQEWRRILDAAKSEKEEWALAFDGKFDNSSPFNQLSEICDGITRQTKTELSCICVSDNDLSAISEDEYDEINKEDDSDDNDDEEELAMKMGNVEVDDESDTPIYFVYLRDAGHITKIYNGDNGFIPLDVNVEDAFTLTPAMMDTVKLFMESCCFEKVMGYIIHQYIEEGRGHREKLQRKREMEKQQKEMPNTFIWGTFISTEK